MPRLRREPPHRPVGKVPPLPRSLPVARASGGRSARQSGTPARVLALRRPTRRAGSASGRSDDLSFSVPVQTVRVDTRRPHGIVRAARQMPDLPCRDPHPHIRPAHRNGGRVRGSLAGTARNGCFAGAGCFGSPTVGDRPQPGGDRDRPLSALCGRIPASCEPLRSVRAAVYVGRDHPAAPTRRSQRVCGGVSGDGVVGSSLFRVGSATGVGDRVRDRGPLAVCPFRFGPDRTGPCDRRTDVRACLAGLHRGGVRGSLAILTPLAEAAAQPDPASERGGPETVGGRDERPDRRARLV